MPFTYACPYWSWEDKLVCHCEIAVLKFPDSKARAEYIRKHCGSVDGWQNCSIAKLLNERYGEQE